MQDVVRVLPPGDDQDRCLIFIADTPKNLETVEAWEAEIHDDEIRSVDLPSSEGLRPIARLDDNETFTSKYVCRQVEDVRIVFNEQDLDHLLPPLCVSVWVLFF